MNPSDLEEDERIQKTLQELCVAEFAQNYCAACASGQGCCAASPASETTPEESEDEMAGVEEGWERERGEGTISRRTLTIDLSKEKELSDGEILKRLLSPLGSPLSDEPLEVILEIIDEDDVEDEDEDESLTSSRSNSSLMTNEKSFSTLREKLKEVMKNDRRSTQGPKSQKQKKRQQFIPTEKDQIENSTRRHFPSMKNIPSYKKANSLINEIEKCFLETANIVEKTLGPMEAPVIQELQQKEQPTLPRETGVNSQFTQTIEEALNIFDSILYDNKVKNKSDNYVESSQRSERKTISEPNNGYGHASREYGWYPNNASNYNDPQRNWYSQISKQEYKYPYQEIPEVKWNSGFERDVDELFKECYELSSVEPSTSLGACLKNLESLCVQLNRAKENIFHEMKDEYRRKSHRHSGSFDQFGSYASSLDSQECLSYINELIEKKLKEKLRHEKFSLGPPLMGLEGRTHKIIAEVLPEKTNLENRSLDFNENEYQGYNFMGNYSKLHDLSSCSYDTMDSLYRDNYHQPDAFFESNSEMSTMTNTLESNRYSYSSPQTGGFTSDDTNKYTLSDASEEEQTSFMNYDETLALYEDNQELQKSLLSILHSLNDIHDNFLNRRRVEMDLSQKSSDFIQNHIKAEINLSDEMRNKSFYPDSSYRPLPDSDIYSWARNGDNMCHVSNRLTDDFESIEKIIEVSDELKNLWLYQTNDLKINHRKPSRSVSFNRGMKRYKNASDSFNETPHSQFINEKSISMPNLSLNETYSQSLHANADHEKVDETNFFAESFVQHMKDENAKCYEVTLNFLQRIMAACDMMDNPGGVDGGFLPPVQPPFPYNAYMKTCQ